MAKGLVFSDLHLHAHKDKVDRLDDCINVLDWIFRTAAERKCDYVFFLGDLFHERSKIDVLNYLRAFECFMRHLIDQTSSFEVFLLVGNHDMYHRERWDINSIKPLSAIPRVNIIDKPTAMNVGGRRIDWMPHTDNPIKELNKLKKEQGRAGDILFGHMAVNGAMLNICYGTKADVIVEYDNDMLPVDPSIFDDWKMTMLGHYHAAQQLTETAEFVGSPLELTFGEAFQKKHIILLDLDTLEKEYIINDFSPKHLIVDKTDIQKQTYKLDGQFVRLCVDDLKEQELLDLKRVVLKEHKPLSFDTKRSPRKQEEDQIIIQAARSVLMDRKEVLKRWCEERGVPNDLILAKLLQIGETCLDISKP